MKQLIIIGAGEHGRVVLDIVHSKRKREYEIFGFLDDAREAFGFKSPLFPRTLYAVRHVPILGLVADFTKFPEVHFVIAIADLVVRRRIYKELLDRRCVLAHALTHHTAYTGHVVLGPTIGRGSTIGAFAHIGPNAVVDDNVIINNHVNVDHDCLIGAHSHLAPGVVLGGGVKIGSGCFIGLGARIRDHVKIGDNVIIGAGSLILHDVAGSGCYGTRTLFGRPTKTECAHPDFNSSKP